MIIVIELILTSVSKGRYYSFKKRRELRYKEMKFLTGAPLANKSQCQELDKNC